MDTLEKYEIGKLKMLSNIDKKKGFSANSILRKGGFFFS
jgi:hypothetical protein